MAARRKRKVAADPLAIPPSRRPSARAIAGLMTPGCRVALLTHVNADGDGVGSEVALWRALVARNVRAVIANPTGVPDRYRFLLDGTPHADKSDAAVKHVQKADVILVVDISDLSRLGHLGRWVEQRGVPVACIDHHVTEGTLPDGPRLVDATACATGELVYDMLRALRWKITPEIARALYVAILTDTGGFRFSNTSARALRVAADLLASGVDPEELYRIIYASNPEGWVRLMAEALETLVVEPDRGLAWVTIPEGALDRHGIEADQLDGIVEFPRSVDGVRLALQFRTVSNGRVKVSFRSLAGVDAAALAGRFGGGGHQRAAGALVTGSLPEVQAAVLAAARRVLG